ncbi:hypothetical protein [Pseudomaricurvus sp.]|uniref:hypothetical protein n=1 Tax=Pseudomaricurvus sp. TaxID=2004510 RepID=UPI003F6C5F02
MRLGSGSHLTPIRTLMLSLLLMSGVFAHADTDSTEEGQWLQYLKNSQSGAAMPQIYMDKDESISLTQEDLQRLTGTYDESDEGKHSKMQFSDLNYQADVSEDYVQLRLFMRF